tara:strand:- start:14 stop:361 length:348 start_codon:yes stop_codon:yes gene_type:complete
LVLVVMDYMLHQLVLGLKVLIPQHLDTLLKVVDMDHQLVLHQVDLVDLVVDLEEITQDLQLEVLLLVHRVVEIMQFLLHLVGVMMVVMEILLVQLVMAVAAVVVPVLLVVMVEII